MNDTFTRQRVYTSARKSVSEKNTGSFEDLIVWREAQALVIEVYKLSEQWKDWGLKDQIRRAIVSVVSNIAEGYERGSKLDFVRFLYIARGSVSEVRAQWYVCRDLKYVDPDGFARIYDKLDYVARMLGKLITSNKREV